MNNKELWSKLLNEKGMMLTVKEIEDIMDAEVAKPEEEMDTELVDLCATVLAEKYHPEAKDEDETPMFCPWEQEENPQETEAPKKKRVIRFKSVLLIAAVLVVLVFVVALPAGAKLFDNKTSDKIIEFYADHFKINLQKEEPTASAQDDLVNQMILDNLDNFVLPEELLSDDFEKSARLTQDNSLTIFYIKINNIDKKISGEIIITQYMDRNFETVKGIANISNIYKYFKQLYINETEVIVFGNDKQIYINYIYENSDYEITLDCDFETAVSIAETIKN